jgi:intracellular septation protein A
MADYPVEAKVKAATGAAVVASFIDWLLSTYVFHNVLPDPVILLISLAVSGAGTLVAGYVAKHQYRPNERPTPVAVPDPKPSGPPNLSY